jgi:hypothetical protein
MSSKRHYVSCQKDPFYLWFTITYGNTSIGYVAFLKKILYFGMPKVALNNIRHMKNLKFRIICFFLWIQTIIFSKGCHLLDILIHFLIICMNYFNYALVILSMRHNVSCQIDPSYLWFTITCGNTPIGYPAS